MESVLPELGIPGLDRERNLRCAYLSAYTVCVVSTNDATHSQVVPGVHSFTILKRVKQPAVFHTESRMERHASIYRNFV